MTSLICYKFSLNLREKLLNFEDRLSRAFATVFSWSNIPFIFCNEGQYSFQQTLDSIQHKCLSVLLSFILKSLQFLELLFKDSFKLLVVLTPFVYFFSEGLHLLDENWAERLVLSHSSNKNLNFGAQTRFKTVDLQRYLSITIELK